MCRKNYIDNNVTSQCCYIYMYIKNYITITRVNYNTLDTRCFVYFIIYVLLYTITVSVLINKCFANVFIYFLYLILTIRGEREYTL